MTGATGCATGGTGARDAKQLGGGPSGTLTGKITIWSWDVAAKAMQRLGKTFEQTHPGTTVEVVDIGYDNAYDKITVGLGAGSGLPDILTIEGGRLPTYIGNFPNALVDLTNRAGNLKSQYSEAAWRTVTDAKGRVFALPWDSGPCGLFYRRDHFQQAGIDPASLNTWDDYLTAGTTLKAATGKKLLILDAKQDTFLSLLLQQQGQAWFTDGKVAVATPAAERALTLMKQLVDRDLVDFENGWDGLVSGTHDGKASTTPIAAWWDGTLTTEMADLSGKFGVLPLPAFTPGGTRTSNNGGSTLCVTAQSRNPETAWAFISFLLADKANQASMMQHEGLFPAYLPALDDPYFQQPAPYYGGQPAMKLFAELARTIPTVERTADDAKAGDIVTTAVNQVLHNGADPGSVLRSAARQIATATGRQSAV
ncbi:ABC transporter substrate-binding protein [Streptomyces sp. FH025]|uniref:ABC transporter substrate-binding protein n=1 Tax=Streptomyces sp. FH025 TaxID=2815937 RepID=UPI001A9D5E7E|nr:sugar ABC transporter substrate-binding protein [Streptomyces sp. FH025]MBO1414049.1 sugar ABC transporter substrate-binding protein [Streptomyces sp. FH025]